MALTTDNKNLHNAKTKKDDEFYTFQRDIQRELINHKKEFEGKIVYMPCDNPKFSAFWKFFIVNFEEFKLKKIISTFLNGYKTEFDGNEAVITKLDNNGDFRKNGNIEADVIVTNPPFSLLREFMDFYKDKKMIVLFPLMQISSQWFIPFLQCGKFRIGYNQVRYFLRADGSIADVKARWITNFLFEKPLKEIKTEQPKKLQKYYNSDVVYLKSYKNVPVDYFGIFGIPHELILYSNIDSEGYVHLKTDITTLFNELVFKIINLTEIPKENTPEIQRENSKRIYKERLILKDKNGKYKDKYGNKYTLPFKRLFLQRVL